MAMNWTTMAPATVESPVFARPDGGWSITLPERRSVGFWETEVPLEAGRSGVRITMSSDAPAALGNNAGVVVTLCRDAEWQIATHYLEPVVRPDGRLDFAGTYPTRGAVSCKISLYYKWQPGTVTFRNLAVTACDEPAARRARLVTTRIYPVYPSSCEANRVMMDKLFGRIAAEVKNPDLVLFSEGVADRHAAQDLVSRSEPAEGPTFQMLSKWSKKLHCYSATTIHEIEDGKLYNTGLLIGRNGELIGKYRKVHLTWGETRWGIIPGTDYPVFELDFGKVGIMTCWDDWFCEAARALRLHGAELLLLPIAGDGLAAHRDHVWATRALENGAYLMSSVTYPSNDGVAPSRIIDPDGVLLAQTAENHSYAVADAEFTRIRGFRYLSVDNSEGDPRSLYVRERRVETYPDGLCHL